MSVTVTLRGKIGLLAFLIATVVKEDVVGTRSRYFVIEWLLNIIRIRQG